ncbi:MAG: glycosyltransferase [Hydrotalea sp.]|nr:glycosyltransferase [Hydrotalea sp.]
MINFTHRLAWYLKKRGHIIKVMALSETHRTEDRVIDGVPVVGMASFAPGIYKKNSFRVAINLGLKKKVEKEIHAFSPDIIHVQGHYPVARTVIALAKQYHIPVIGTNHSIPENIIHYIPFYRVPWIEKSFCRWAWRDFCRVYEQVDRTTTPTKSSIDIMQKNGYKRTVLPISCGIDTDLFNPKHNDPYLLDKYNLPKDKKLLLFVGRVDLEKKIDFVLQAMAKLPKNSGKNSGQDYNCHFVVAGRGAELENLKKLSKTLGLEHRVSFLGFVPDEDLPGLYALANCFIIASIAELQSLVTMEAMASGLPILAARVAALPELVKSGKNGYLFDLKNPAHLALKIKKIFDNEALRATMGKASLAMIKKHNIDNTMHMFEKLYDETIAEKMNRAA